MRIAPLHWLSVLALLLSSATPVFADEAEKESSDEQAPKKEVVKIDGVFASKVTHEITADSEQITSFEIKRILPHGESVSKGASVVWFESKDIDTRIDKAEMDLSLAKISYEEAEFAFEQFVEQQELDRKAAELARQEARQAYDNFVNIDREQQIRTAEYQLQRSRESLEYAEEELGQLQKMYDEDDLTEESEEIVLKRARRAVERAKFDLEIAENRTQRTLEQTIPSQQEKQEAALARAELAYAKAIQELKTARGKREIERRKQKKEFDKQQADLKELQAERRALVLTSPISGLVYHGKLTRGRLSEKPSTLEPKSKVSARQVLVTVVQPDRLKITSDLSEDQRAKIEVGMKGSAIPKAFPDLKIPVTVQSIAPVPYASNKIECVLVINGKVKKENIVPGMTCSIEFEQAEKE
ncbi:HlyD family efflux transporter periplasmic adaptor subunit [Aporhodopirellula aestuarii]|uniref:HlyD family efflux transporter periplasmic adaptor subunit n=1 Tax=Aporhodopirellula aestuarii TaxID=2950107 RepID=A0ABT0U0K2_9BACT|nr:HlyD family efflux transporter periplasmic adaptor subunit [Aporhodopirellula aestuarii]MCM2370399.1 HlyD family efflux transporter periplasmic adaptor subunit [Aporhodopirellula aestuarii]